MNSTLHDGDERDIILPSDVKGLVEISRHAKNSNHYMQPPDNLRLGGWNREVQLWGENAASDFIETHWRDIVSYLNEAAAAGQTSAVILMPEMGYRALTTVQAFLEKALPDCEISAPGSKVTIKWGHLV